MKIVDSQEIPKGPLRLNLLIIALNTWVTCPDGKLYSWSCLVDLKGTELYIGLIKEQLLNPEHNECFT